MSDASIINQKEGRCPCTPFDPRQVRYWQLLMFNERQTAAVAFFSGFLCSFRLDIPEESSELVQSQTLMLRVGGLGVET
jgi:hypothetical protein